VNVYLEEMLMTDDTNPLPPPLAPETREAFRLLLELAERAARRAARVRRQVTENDGE